MEPVFKPNIELLNRAPAGHAGCQGADEEGGGGQADRAGQEEHRDRQEQAGHFTLIKLILHFLQQKIFHFAVPAGEVHRGAEEDHHPDGGAEGDHDGRREDLHDGHAQAPLLQDRDGQGGGPAGMFIDHV